MPDSPHWLIAKEHYDVPRICYDAGVTNGVPVEPSLTRSGGEWWQRDAAGLVSVHRCLRRRCPRRAVVREVS
jgi:hypothetical protein